MGRYNPYLDHVPSGAPMWHHRRMSELSRRTSCRRAAKWAESPQPFKCGKVAAGNKSARERVRGGGRRGRKVYWMVCVCYLLSHLAVRRHNQGHRSAACGHAKKRCSTPMDDQSARCRERQGEGSVAGAVRTLYCPHLPGAFDGSGRLAGFPPPCAPPCARGKEGGQDCHAARLWQMQTGAQGRWTDQGNPQRTRMSGTFTPR